MNWYKLLAVLVFSFQASANNEDAVIASRGSRGPKASAYLASHGKSNGGNFKATRFAGFGHDLDMTPLGPLRTAEHVASMPHYAAKDFRQANAGMLGRSLGCIVLDPVEKYL